MYMYIIMLQMLDLRIELTEVSFDPPSVAMLFSCQVSVFVVSKVPVRTAPM